MPSGLPFEIVEVAHSPTPSIVNIAVSEIFPELLINPHKEIISLLSLKHNVDEQIAENIFDEYLLKHDSFFRFVKLNDLDSMNVSTEYRKTITELSKKYNIPENKLAEIIYDYRLFSALESIESSH